jgi:hypothetical protein
MKGMGQRMMLRSGPMMEARLAYIKADLQITEAQLPAREGYADAVRARRSTMAMETKLDGLKARRRASMRPG